MTVKCTSFGYNVDLVHSKTNTVVPLKWLTVIYTTAIFDYNFFVKFGVGRCKLTVTAGHMVQFNVRVGSRRFVRIFPCCTKDYETPQFFEKFGVRGREMTVTADHIVQLYLRKLVRICPCCTKACEN